MNEIIEHFSKHIAVSEQLEKEIRKRIRFQSFKKGSVIQHANKVCVESHFVKSGVLRLYFFREEKQISEYFCAEEEWVNSPRSFIFRELDQYYIDAIENAEVFTLHVKDLIYLFDNFPEMERYARLSMGTMFYQLVERITSMRFTSAREKYEHFCRTYKEIHPRLPLGMVASYLGISQETLSRVRAKR